MSEKTEKPTPKKLRDAAKKGQTFKSKDITAVIVLAVGALSLSMIVNLRRVMFEFARVASTGAMPDPNGYFHGWAMLFMRLVVPFVLLCAVAGALPSLMQSRFMLAVEAIKLDLTAVNPMKGLKKLFSIRSVKELIKALLYVVVCGVAIAIFIGQSHQEIFQLFRAEPAMLAHIWIKLTVRLILLFLLCSLPILFLDALVEFFLYYKDLKMDKHEVKQEHKESDGNPEIKSRRREVHMELLSEEIKSSIKQSDLVLANPTHIAIGIYFNAEVVPLPFVSVRETNARALAVIRYAELEGVPVVRDIPLARSIYRNSRRFSFVGGDDLEAVMRVLIWLKQVELASAGIEIPDAGGASLQADTEVAEADVEAEISDDDGRHDDAGDRKENA